MNAEISDQDRNACDEQQLFRATSGPSALLHGVRHVAWDRAWSTEPPVGFQSARKVNCASEMMQSIAIKDAADDVGHCSGEQLTVRLAEKVLKLNDRIDERQSVEQL